MRQFLLLGLTFIASGAFANPLRICVGDVNVWAPFTYWQGTSEQEQTDSLTGFATTLVLEALQDQHIDYQINFMPWARIQHELAHDNGRCDLTWDASHRAEREAYSYFSVPLYTIQLGYFTLPEQKKDLQSPKDSGVLCGVNGFNYEGFALSREPSLYLNSVQQALNMLQKERCDWFVSEIEPIYGGIQLGVYVLQRQITHHSLGKNKQYHVQVRRSLPNALPLINGLNQYFLNAQKTGHAQTVFDRYLSLPLAH
ncbi:ABC transporter substrate-binding protein [Vibrio tarriae]|uniref:substrate-binding periplasmic protein n=1 Tax=Vibrio tarriae TaxID=2014742 RepID=UPI000DE38ED1|nr:ABC transporter substrate-binding protein [Vibrio tarriae]RBM30959.1 ABC transporter substrate-binding protein [Vibrio tarriae]RBM50106.1 ABC transporter substrate-binding protein [Vibrio tarriae]RBM70796.1 ABC transporter substrate-binding protein [Vibrio tarriae]